MNLNLRNSDQKLQEMKALWNEWDPCRASPEDKNALDEYDYYLIPTIKFLRKVPTIVEIENYLIFVLTKRIGFNKRLTSLSNPHEFAIKLQNWLKN